MPGVFGAVPAPLWCPFEEQKAGPGAALSSRQGWQGLWCPGAQRDAAAIPFIPGTVRAGLLPGSCPVKHRPAWAALPGISFAVF